MIVQPFRYTDLALIDVQPVQRAELDRLDVRVRRVYEQHSRPAVSLIEGGVLLTCFGLMPGGGSRAILWAFGSAHAGPHMLKIARFVRKLLDDCEYDRVEATVLAGFEPGHRLLRVIGMQDETPNGMQKFSPDGAHHLYARVR